MLTTEMKCRKVLWKFVGIWIVTFWKEASQVVKNLPASTGDTGDMDSIPGSGRSPREGHGNPLQYSCLENPHGQKAWRATMQGVTKSWIQLKWLSTRWWTPSIKPVLTNPECTDLTSLNFCNTQLWYSLHCDYILSHFLIKIIVGEIFILPSVLLPP